MVFGCVTLSVWVYAVLHSYFCKDRSNCIAIATNMPSFFPGLDASDNVVTYITFLLINNMKCWLLGVPELFIFQKLDVLWMRLKLIGN